MTTKTLILIFLSVQFLTPCIHAQDLFLNTSALIRAGTVSECFLLDVGLETAVSKKWNCQLSYTLLNYTGEGASQHKKIWSLQVRTYPLDSIFKSKELAPYYGFIFQKYRLKDYKGLYIKPNDTISRKYSTNINSDQLGLGGILGSHIKIYKGVGLDFHIGLIAQIGEKNTHLIFVKNGKLLPETKELEKGKITFRPFWGLNLYFAFD